MPHYPKPRWRKDRSTYVVEIRKVLHTLGPDEEAAWAAYHALMAGHGLARPKASLTVYEAAHAFLEHSRAVHAPGTVAAYHGQVQPVVDGLGRVRLDELKPTRIERWMAGRDVADDTKRNYVEALRAAVRYCRREGLYDGPDPTEGVKMPRAGRRERTLTPEERERLWAAASPALRDLLLVVASTGCRPHVAEGIEAADVRWAEGVAVRRSKRKEYVVHLPAAALGRLRELAAERPTGPLLRTARGRKWNRDNRAAAMRRACLKAGLEGVVPYSLRHSFATDALEKGVPAALVASLLNHSDLGMVSRVYGHVAERRATLRAAAEDAARAAGIAAAGPGSAPRSDGAPGATSPGTRRRRTRGTG